MPTVSSSKSSHNSALAQPSSAGGALVTALVSPGLELPLDSLLSPTGVVVVSVVVWVSLVVTWVVVAAVLVDSLVDELLFVVVLVDDELELSLVVGLTGVTGGTEVGVTCVVVVVSVAVVVAVVSVPPVVPPDSQAHKAEHRTNAEPPTRREIIPSSLTRNAAQRPTKVLYHTGNRAIPALGADPSALTCDAAR